MWVGLRDSASARRSVAHNRVQANKASRMVTLGIVNGHSCKQAVGGDHRRIRGAVLTLPPIPGKRRVRWEPQGGEVKLVVLVFIYLLVY